MTTPIRIGLLLLLGLTFISRGPSVLAERRQAALPDQSKRARELLEAKRVLTAAEVAEVQAAVKAALAGKYAVQRVVDGSGKAAASGREDEYLLDQHARIRFHRYALPDTALPGGRLGTILEFTDIPAVRCHDRSALPGRRLGITYAESRKGWYIGNPMVVDENGSPWAMGSPGYDLLHSEAKNIRDLGERQNQGQLTRGFNISPAPKEVSVWIGVQSLLPIVETMVLTMEGRRVEVWSLWTYPPPRGIAPPPGVKAPDCA